MNWIRKDHIRQQAHGKTEYLLMHIPIHIAIMLMVFGFFMVPASLPLM